MQNNAPLIVIGIIVVLVVGGLISYLSYQETAGPSIYDEFAQCLSDKGATFYGAFWCPHCQAQKKMFGNAAKLLPYVECSTPDGQNQLQVCKDQGIKNYPTWIFADHSSTTGEAPLALLSEKTGCELPTIAGQEPVPVEVASSSPVN